MALARFGWEGSDVYVLLSVVGHLECCGCTLSDNWEYYSTESMLAHLREHQEAGETVPPDCIARLEKERDENDAFIAEKANVNR